MRWSDPAQLRPGCPRMKRSGRRTFGGLYYSSSVQLSLTACEGLLKLNIAQVGVPYIRAKAQDYYESLGGGLDAALLEDGGSRSHIRALQESVSRPKFSTSFRYLNHVRQTYAGWLRRGFKAAYPWLNATFEIWILICNMAYLFEKTPYYRPWLRWAGIDIRRLTADDYVRALPLDRKDPAHIH